MHAPRLRTLACRRADTVTLAAGVCAWVPVDDGALGVAGSVDAVSPEQVSSNSIQVCVT